MAMVLLNLKHHTMFIESFKLLDLLLQVNLIELVNVFSVMT